MQFILININNILVIIYKLVVLGILILIILVKTKYRTTDVENYRFIIKKKLIIVL